MSWNFNLKFWLDPWTMVSLAGLLRYCYANQYANMCGTLHWNATGGVKTVIQAASRPGLSLSVTMWGCRKTEYLLKYPE